MIPKDVREASRDGSSAKTCSTCRAKELAAHKRVMVSEAWAVRHGEQWLADLRPTGWLIWTSFRQNRLVFFERDEAKKVVADAISLSGVCVVRVRFFKVKQ